MTIAAPAHSPVLPSVSVELSTRRRVESAQPGAWRRLSYWPLEFVRLLAAIYMLPVALLVIGVPIGLALTGLFLGAAWLWRALW